MGKRGFCLGLRSLNDNLYYSIFVQIYEGSFGEAAEQFGPMSPQAERALRIIDQFLQNFLARLQAAQMGKSVNVILMSDHGIASADDRTVGVSRPSIGRALDKYGASHWVRMVVGDGAYSMVYLKRGMERFMDKVVHALKKGMGGCQVYAKEEIPERLHWAVSVKRKKTSKKDCLN